MKTQRRWVWVSAAAVLGLALSVGATEVSSRNIVGMIRVDVPQGLSLMSTPLNRIGEEPPTLLSVFGENVPDGTQVIRYDREQPYMPYEYITFYEGDGWLDDDFVVVNPDLARGRGFWVVAPSAFTVALSGEVPENAAETIEIGAGLQILSFAFPADQQVAFNDISSLQPNDGDQIIFFAQGSGYDYLTFYDGDGWLDDDFNERDLDFRVGESFWYYSMAAFTWHQDKPY